MNKIKEQLIKDLADNIIKEIKRVIKKDEYLNGFIGINIPLENIDPDASNPPLQMRIFPLKDVQIHKNNGKTAVRIPETKKLILERPRLLEDFFYFKNNLRDYSRLEDNDIYNLKINVKEISWKENKYILNNNSKLFIEFKKKKNKEIVIFSDDLIKEIVKEKELQSKPITNLADVFLLGKDALKNLIGMPFSFFTTPTVLLIKNCGHNTKNKAGNINTTRIDTIHTLQKKIRDHIYYYIYKRILVNATELIKQNTTEDFIEKFVLELAEVLLPVRYKIGKNRKKDLFTMWLSGNEEEPVEKIDVELKDKAGKVLSEVNFELKSYTLPYTNNQANWLHESKDPEIKAEYEKIKDYSIDLIKRLFTLLYTQWEDKNQIHKESIKSSLAAVMARNQSHNLGAHVLNKLSGKSNIEAFIKLVQNNGGFDSPYSPTVIKDKDKTPSEMFRVFNSYLKNRMDLIADIATTDSALSLTVKKLFSDVFYNFEKNQLLLRYISGKDSNFKYTFKLCYNGKCKGKDGYTDPDIVFPNDVLGEQAFFIILENIIRNTAKHSQVSAYTQVEFTINLIDERLSDYYRVEIFDNIEGGDLPLLTLKRNINIAKNILDDQNKIRTTGWGTIEMKLATAYLSRVKTFNIDNYEYTPVINEELVEGYNTALTDDENKTLEKIKKERKKWEETLYCKEKKYIKEEKKDVFNEDTSYTSESNIRKTNSRRKSKGLKRFPLLQAIYKEQDRGFGYQFLLKKPKKVLIIDKSEQQDLKINNELKKQGVRVISHNTLNPQNIFSHDYVLVYFGDNKCDNDYINEIHKNTKMPNTVYTLSQNKLCYQPDLQINNNKCIDKIDLKDGGLRLNKLIDLLNKSYLEYLKPVCDLDFPIYDQNLKNYINNDIKVNNKNCFFSRHSLAKNVFDSSYYSELYGSASKLGIYFDNKKKAIENAEDPIEKLYIARDVYTLLQKAVNTKVVVIDERVQAVLNEIAYSVESNGNITPYNISYKDLFEKTKITVPPLPDSQNEINNTQENEIFNLNDTNIYKDKEKIFNFIKKSSRDADYLIIHFGIMESLRDENNNLKSIYEEINEKIGKTCKLVITSGRGYTPDIKSLDAYFINYSTISNLLIDPFNRSKMHLVSLLNSLRK